MPRRKCQGTDSADPHQKIARWSAERRRPDRKGRGRLASARHVLATRARGPRKPPRLSALRPPLTGQVEGMIRTRAHERAAGTKKRARQTGLRCLTS